MNLFQQLFGGAPSKVVRHPNPKVVRHNRQGHSSGKLVTRDSTPLAVRRGWRQRGQSWTGSYATLAGTFPGSIERRGDRFVVHIKNPPDDMRSHPKWACFSRRSKGWWNINMNTNPVDKDVSAIILYVERILAEALNLPASK